LAATRVKLFSRATARNGWGDKPFGVQRGIEEPVALRFSKTSFATGNAEKAFGQPA
jgi:hypothetical protein